MLPLFVSEGCIRRDPCSPQRAALLEHIREKQQVLDQVDYLIWEQSTHKGN